MSFDQGAKVQTGSFGIGLTASYRTGAVVVVPVEFEGEIVYSGGLEKEYLMSEEQSPAEKIKFRIRPLPFPD